MVCTALTLPRGETDGHSPRQNIQYSAKKRQGLEISRVNRDRHTCYDGHSCGLAVISRGDSKIAFLIPRLEMNHGNLDRVYVFQKRNNMYR